MTYEMYKTRIEAWTYNTEPDVIHKDVEETVKWARSCQDEDRVRDILETMKKQKNTFMAQHQAAVKSRKETPQMADSISDLQRQIADHDVETSRITATTTLIEGATTEILYGTMLKRKDRDERALIAIENISKDRKTDDKKQGNKYEAFWMSKISDNKALMNIKTFNGDRGQFKEWFEKITTAI